MPRVSVCVVTTRPGGLDVLLAGLARQEFRDFEVILVDGIYHRRAEVAGDAFHDAGIQLIHTPPRRRMFPFDACPEARNTAIARASGELLVWLVDYSIMSSGWLREHWGVYEATGKRVVGMGAHRYLSPPKPAYELPEYSPIVKFPPNETDGCTYAYSERSARQFAEDISRGFYDRWMYSIFDPPLDYKTAMDLPEDPYFFNADPKLTGMTGGWVYPWAFHAKNEGTPRERCVLVNGFDEEWTGHCYDDSDMGLRLGRSGLEWMLLDPSAIVHIVNPRHFFPHLVWRGTPGDSEGRYREREKSDVVMSGNSWEVGSIENATWYG